jgi:hypothetical protein
MSSERPPSRSGNPSPGSPPPGWVDLETIVLSSEGVFLSNGEPIAHERTVEAFHRHIGRDDEGFYIEIGHDFKRIEVEDTVYFVFALEWDSDGCVMVLNDGSRERVKPEALLWSEGRLVHPVKEGCFEARFTRGTYSEFFLRTLESSDGNGVIIQLTGIRSRLTENTLQA